jgi:hypothetical protein
MSRCFDFAHMKRNALGAVVVIAWLLAGLRCLAAEASSGPHRFLYVAEPGIRDYLQYGGHGLLVFDIDHGHQFVRRIPTGGLDEKGKPLNVKGVCANATTRRIYISTTRTILCIDLLTDKLLWEKSYDGGCDRLALSPDGKIIYAPSLEGDHWNVVDAITGAALDKILRNSGAHNTIFGLDGSHVYLAGLKSPTLTVMDARTHAVSATVGPFGNVIRPFTVNGSQTLCFVNVNGLLGFEIGDLRSGKVLHRVEIPGSKPGTEKRHGCPSHGIGLTPDEAELWLTDAANSELHIFDTRAMPPKPIDVVHLRDQPGWITFGIDGRFAYPSTGDVVDVKTRKIVAELTDEQGQGVQSEKLLEIDFKGAEPVKTGDQFGLGRKRS